MGAIISATELAFGKNEVRSADSMSHALVRIGIMGGLTMVSMNVLGAWSCVEGAAGISDASWLPLGKDYHTPQDHECLREYCVKTNTVWAFVSAMTGALLCAAGMARSKSLLICFFAVLTARGTIAVPFDLAHRCTMDCLRHRIPGYFHILNKAAAVHSAALRVRDKAGALKGGEWEGEERRGSRGSMREEEVGLEDGRMAEAGRKAMQSLAEGGGSRGGKR